MTDTSTVLLETPLGPMVLTGDDAGLTAAEFTETPPPGTPTSTEHPVLEEARRQLQAYFAGDRTSFDVPVAPRGTPFQLRVWEQLQRIPYGTTVSYGEIAARLGMAPGASRAVGLANGANPIAIIVPCHRVIGANGKLVGYAAGLPRKRFLLGHEAPGLQGFLLEA